MASTFSVTERIEHIDSLDDALPFLRALPLNIIKMFLSSSAKHGFFDDLNWSDLIEEDDECPTNPLSVSTADLSDDEDTKSSKDSATVATLTGPQASEFVFKMNKSNTISFIIRRPLSHPVFRDLLSQGSSK